MTPTQVQDTPAQWPPVGHSDRTAPQPSPYILGDTAVPQSPAMSQDRSSAARTESPAMCTPVQVQGEQNTAPSHWVLPSGQPQYRQG